MNLIHLRKLLEKCWDKETCYEPMRADYHKHTSSYGQCHCTALLVHDFFGGKLLKFVWKNGFSHYSNIIDGRDVDLTEDQFDDDEIFPEPEIIERKDTKEDERYHLLKKRLQRLLEKESR